MKITGIRIHSYKGFSDSEWIDLSEHFTVLVGQNSAGKSALLQCFSPGQVGQHPHRSPERQADARLEQSSVDFKLLVQGTDIAQAGVRNGALSVPTVNNDKGEEVARRHFHGERTYRLSYIFGHNEWTSPDAPSYGVFDPSQFGLASHTFVSDGTPMGLVSNGQSSGPGGDTLPTLIGNLLQATTFAFDAERYSIGRIALNGSVRLARNASNLPYMLSMLSKHHARFEAYQRLVSEVLPSIRRVLVSPVGNEMEISIQSHTSLRADLAVPLDECGTGVAQILAILYVVVAYDSATIVIDEPNSFLHPGATRRLLNVLKRHDQHQYVISTHAPEVMSILRPDTLLLLRWNSEQGRTEIVESRGNDIAHLRNSMEELGASVGDLFGFETVVFVEGPTEADCFPLLLDESGRAVVNFIAMREASAMTRDRSPEAMYDIYKRGVEGSALQPPAVAFSFDLEGRSDREVEDAKRASGGAAKFLPEVMYETYLLHPEAIAVLLGSLENGVVTTPAAVDSWLSAHFADYPLKGRENLSIRTANAAKMLDSLFNELTETRWGYNKREHGKALTSWILQHDPAHMESLREYVGSLVAVRTD